MLYVRVKIFIAACIAITHNSRHNKVVKLKTPYTTRTKTFTPLKTTTMATFFSYILYYTSSNVKHLLLPTGNHTTTHLKPQNLYSQDFQANKTQYRGSQQDPLGPQVRNFKPNRIGISVYIPSQISLCTQYVLVFFFRSLSISRS